MNSFRLKFITVLAALFAVSTAFAGSIDYLSNQSGKFFMTMSREAATDAADIAAFNPAGTALMKKGLYVDVSSQTFLKYYKNKDVKVAALGWDESYESTQPSPVVPNAYLVYNFGKVGSGSLAVFGGVGAPAGGGTVKWDGTAGIVGLGAAIGVQASSALQKADVKLDAYSVYYGVVAGGAYSFLNDMVSLSAGVRYNYGDRWGKIKGSLDYMHGGLGAWTLNVDSKYKYTAHGFTPILGLDVRPVNNLTLGFRYEMETEMNFKYDQEKLEVSASNAAFNAVSAGVKAKLNNDGKKMNRNLPHMLAFSAEYALSPKFTVSTGVRAWLMSKADLEGEEEYYKTGYELSLGLAYQILDNLKLAASGMFTNQGTKDSYYESPDYLPSLSPNPVINSVTMGVGGIYSFNENFDFYLALAWAHYLPKDVKANGMEFTYSKDVYNIGLGVSYKL